MRPWPAAPALRPDQSPPGVYEARRPVVRTDARIDAPWWKAAEPPRTTRTVDDLWDFLGDFA